MISQIQDFKSGITVVVKDKLKETIERESGGKNTVIYDALGNPNIMYVLPAFRWEDIETMFPDYNLGLTGSLPAFLDKNGNQRSEIFIGKYLSSLSGDTIVSKHNAIPFNFTTLSDVKQKITLKGPGWHLLSIHEYTAILLRMRLLFGFDEITGNSFRGRNIARGYETGIIIGGGVPGIIGDGTPKTTLTGSGPITWNHDRTEYGISDFQGNCWETLDQVLLTNGLLQTTDKNDHTAPLIDTTTFFDNTTAGTLASHATLGNVKWNHTIVNRNGDIDDNGAFAYCAMNTGVGPEIEPGYVADALTKAILLHPHFPDQRKYFAARNYGSRLLIAGGGSQNSPGASDALRSYWFVNSVNASSSAGYRLAFY